MSTTVSNSVLNSVVTAVTSIVGIPELAAAQAPAGAAAIEEITVTARRREETLKDVPIAMTAYTGEALDLRGAFDITELQKDTPNLTLQVARGSNSTLIAFIRGVGQQDPLWGFEPGVGLYVDDVYIARPQAAVLDIFDIERIEVLRGPQGTLYGRNTVGGAIKYVTDRISAEPEGEIRVAYGSYNQREIIASGSAPLSDTVSVSGAVARYLRDGYGENLNTGAEHYNKDVAALRASIEWTPSADLFFRLAADATWDDSNPRHGHRELAPSPADVYDTNAGAGDRNSVETSGLSLLGEWRASDTLTFKSITAYRQGETLGPIDFDNLPAPLLDIPAFYEDHQFSQEFQALFEGDRWQGVFGVYYMDAYAAGAFDTVIGALSFTTLTSGSVETESIAAFGDFSFDFTDRLSASIGRGFEPFSGRSSRGTSTSRRVAMPACVQSLARLWRAGCAAHVEAPAHQPRADGKLDLAIAFAEAPARARVLLEKPRVPRQSFAPALRVAPRHSGLALKEHARGARDLEVAALQGVAHAAGSAALATPLLDELALTLADTITDQLAQLMILQIEEDLRPHQRELHELGQLGAPAVLRAALAPVLANLLGRALGPPQREARPQPR